MMIDIALAAVPVAVLVIGIGGVIWLYMLEVQREAEGMADFDDERDLDTVRSFGRGIDAMGEVVASVRRLRERHDDYAGTSVRDPKWHDAAYAHLSAEQDLFDALDRYDEAAVL